MGIPHVLVLCRDPGIRWDSPKGAAVHLRAITAGLRHCGATVSLLLRDGLAEWPDGADRPGAFTPVRLAESQRTYFAGGESQAFKEASHLAANPGWIEAAQTLHRRHPIDLIYERFSLWSDLGARLATQTGAPLVLEVNAPLLREQRRYRRLALEALAEEMEGLTLRAATRVISVSRPLARELEGKGVPAERLCVLPNIAEASAFRLGERPLPLPGQPFVIGFTGSLKPWHGVAEFLETFARLHRIRPQVRFRVVGAGPERERLEAWVEAQGLGEAVRFLGHLPHHAIPGELHGWNVAVAPYPPLDDFYFSPLKIAEYLAAGLPVMASRLGDIPEMLESGKLGTLVDPGNDDDWLQSLVRAVDHPSTLVAPAARAAEKSASWSWAGQARSSVEGLIPLPRKESVHATP